VVSSPPFSPYVAYAEICLAYPSMGLLWLQPVKQAVFGLSTGFAENGHGPRLFSLSSEKE
jgi:hypothetical protein